MAIASNLLRLLVIGPLALVAVAGAPFAYAITQESLSESRTYPRPAPVPAPEITACTDAWEDAIMAQAFREACQANAAQICTKHSRCLMRLAILSGEMAPNEFAAYVVLMMDTCQKHMLGDPSRGTLGYCAALPEWQGGGGMTIDGDYLVMSPAPPSFSRTH